MIGENDDGKIIMKVIKDNDERNRLCLKHEIIMLCILYCLLSVKNRNHEIRVSSTTITSARTRTRTPARQMIMLVLIDNCHVIKDGRRGGWKKH
jgi:hypothetical protein